MPKAMPAARARSLRQVKLHWVIGVALVLLSGGSLIQRADAKKLQDSLKIQSMSVRLVGRASSTPVTTFGANYQSFVAAFYAHNNHDVTLVKLVYRFLSYDQDLPAALMDYTLVHRFRARRQPDCDESADSILYSRHSSPSGKMLDREFSFSYARNAAGVTMPPAAILPCYVIAPADYKGSKRVPLALSGAVVAEK